MSYDLHVIAKRQPRAADLDSFLAGQGTGVVASGPLKRAGSLVLHHAAGLHVELDGPARLEAEDVPPAALGAIGKSGWLTALSVKGDANGAWPARLAEHLARAADGVVYDPQLDAVTWPKGWRPRATGTSSGRQVIDVVALDWYLPGRAEDRNTPLQLLQLLREAFPAALPRRYGEYEPLQHRFAGDEADAPFADFWQAQAADPLGFFFWATTRPWLGATVARTSARELLEYPVAQPCTRITLGLDSRPLFRDPALTERLIELFAEVAERLNALYAAACLNRGYVLLANGALSGGGEVSPLPLRAAWFGLPAGPTWLAWFGRPYAERVRPVVGSLALETEAGLLLRVGDQPLNADELAPLFPPLPARLLTRRRNRKGRWLAGERYSMGTAPPGEPAEEIPPLE